MRVRVCERERIRIFLFFYVQSTSTVITSGRETDNQTDRQTDRQRQRQRHRERIVELVKVSCVYIVGVISIA